jgi:hypothetical protein
MINFNELEIQKTPVWKDEKTNRGRYVIGCNPFDTVPGKNVYTIYDKFCNRFTTRVVTTRTFDEWVTDYLKGEEDKKLHVVSYKFIDGTTGGQKTIQSIRDAAGIRI